MPTDYADEVTHEAWNTALEQDIIASDDIFLVDVRVVGLGHGYKICGSKEERRQLTSKKDGTKP